MTGAYDYGLWGAVVFNILFFSFFVLGFIRPVKKREWRNMGVIQGFIVALYAEMFGFPLTIFILNSLFGVRFAALNPFSHTSGHLLATLGVGVELASLVCQIGSLFMLVGLGLMGIGWFKIHRARGGLVRDGIYAHVRHPQYTGLFLLILGMLVQWPTLATVAMAPVLGIMYCRLAKKEEEDMVAQFGEEYVAYRDQTPAFFPFIGGRKQISHV